MIVITGAAGFIGSCMVEKLNQENFNSLILVDDFSKKEKKTNYQDKKYLELVERTAFWQWVQSKEADIQCVIHLGARTDTTEKDTRIFDALNLNYSQRMWELCSDYQIPLIYASSAATYGDGALGFDDDPSLLDQLAPLNPYGVSKNEFDKWALAQKKAPFFWAGLKFFNVYGPNEYHKGRMASVIFHAFHQIKKTNKMKLFRSHKEAYADGEQLRDFIYVKDVVSVIYFLMQHRKDSGIYNLGTGKARHFNDLTLAVFKALDLAPHITYIDTPIDIRDTYQYFTEARMDKLHNIGYSEAFWDLESGVEDYVKKYLISSKYF